MSRDGNSADPTSVPHQPDRRSFLTVAGAV